MHGVTVMSADSPRLDGKRPEDFMMLSRRILLLASQGPPRISFLRRVSHWLLDFSECDALELRVYGRVRYNWQAAFQAQPQFTFEIFANGATAPAPARQDDLPFWDQFRYGKLDPVDPCVTEHGSLWTADRGQLRKWCAGHHQECPVPQTAVSLAIIPLVIDDSDDGILVLRGEQPRLFSAAVMAFYESVAHTVGLAIADRRAQAALRERMKELTCLYGIARVVKDTPGAIEERLRRCVAQLPPAWQYDDIAVARVVFDGKEFATPGFDHVRVRQNAPLTVANRDRGLLEVGYVEERPDFIEGPFLPEEQNLIEAVAREISLSIERDEIQTQQDQLQEQLRHSERLATIGQLAAGVAHEVNEPLGAILGFAQLAAKAPNVTPETQQDLGKIVSASLNAREIIRKLMLFARQAPPSKQWLSVNHVVADALSLLESRCQKEGVRVVTTLPPDLPEVHADPVQLHQVLVNLIVNAMQAMPRGGILTILTRPEERAVVISVKDTGVGIPRELQERIFSPFFTTKDVGQGTGLGLSVTHGIVTAHGGSITVESKVGVGTRFDIRLPCDANGTAGG